jgi:hypothetical protein
MIRRPQIANQKSNYHRSTEPPLLRSADFQVCCIADFQIGERESSLAGTVHTPGKTRSPSAITQTHTSLREHVAPLRSHNQVSVERHKVIRFEYDGIVFEEGFRVDLLVEGRVVVEAQVRRATGAGP